MENGVQSMQQTPSLARDWQNKYPTVGHILGGVQAAMAESQTRTRRLPGCKTKVLRRRGNCRPD